MSSSRRRWHAIVVVAAIAIGLEWRATVPADAQDLAWQAHLAGIEATGSKRIPTASVSALSGLKLGAMIGPNDVDGARQRLLKSGYFRSVGYRFRNAGYSVILTFTLEDVAWKTPVIFDNFVDQSDAQLIAAVAKDVPSFDGMAPDNEIVLKRITDTLERVAAEAKDPGSVSYAMIADQPGALSSWRLRITRASGEMPVCSVVFDGISESSVPALADRKAALIGEDYSKNRILKYAKATFAPLLPAPLTIRQIDARRAPVTETCPHGTAVTVKVGTGLFSTAYGL